MPTLIIVNGLPASGKSTLADALSQRLHLPIFKKDELKELLADITGIVELKSSRLYGKASYILLYLLARKLLESNYSLIIEGNFMEGKETTAFAQYLNQKEYMVVELLCYASKEVLFDRYSARKRHAIHHVLPPEAFKSLLYKEKGPSLGVGEKLDLDLSDFSKVSYDEIADQVKRCISSALGRRIKAKL